MNFSNVIDLLHFLQSVLFVTGGFILPIQYLPIFICAVTWMLSRYHDYCIISEFARSGQNYINGCREKKDFTRDCLKIYEKYGINMTVELSSNLLTTFLAINIIVSLYRISVFYNFPILFVGNTKRKRLSYSLFIIIVLILILFGEAFIHIIYYKELDMPSCDEMFTEYDTIFLPKSSTRVDSVLD
jgi:hypothetical protein